MKKLALLTMLAVGTTMVPAAGAAPFGGDSEPGFSLVDKKTKKRAKKSARKASKRAGKLARKSVKSSSKTFRKATKRGSKDLRKAIKRWTKGW